MKSIFILNLIMAIIPELLFALPPQNTIKPVRVQTMDQQIQFRVTGQTNLKTQRVNKIGAFRLNPQERKAVAITDTKITRIENFTMPVQHTRISQKKVFMLPEYYFARVKGTNDPISYRIMFIDEAPLRYDFANQIFEGTIRFIPVEINDSENNLVTEKQLSVQDTILVSYGSVSLPLIISNVNWPPLDVSVKYKNPKDSLAVKIITLSNPAGYPKNLPVEPAIILSSTRTSIQGLGIQTLPVHVSLFGISKYKPVPLTIESSLGSIDSASLILTDDTPREVILRSESIGIIDLKVINPNYKSNTISVRAIVPWVFLILAISGGVVGGIGKTLHDKEKITIRILVLGASMGLIAAIAYWGLGISLIKFSFEVRGINEAMVTGLGLIAGYFGFS
jgi:hypothetical protein